MKLNELDEWVKNKAKPGDLAYHYDAMLEHFYTYYYIKPEPRPFWRLWTDQGVLQDYLTNLEESEMKKRCENCQYHKNFICCHPEHIGMLVPNFTVCPEYEAKEELPGPLDNLKFFLKNKDTGELTVKYVCEDCGKVMEKPFNWQFRMPIAHNGKKTSRPGYYFFCEECDKKKASK
jgi:hypothetical protein